MKNYTFMLEIIFILLISSYTKFIETKVIEGRIVSGEPAKVGEFPWQVIVKVNEVDTLKCGGSIISSCWVLTAAHCTKGLDSVFLVFGTIQLDNTVQNMTSDEIYEHPYYSPPNKNDIALIKLPRPLTFSETIKPITLITSSHSAKSFVGSTTIIAGFGTTDDEYTDYSHVLLWAQVKIIPNKYCKLKYPKTEIDDTNLCAIGDDNTNMSTCNGDSGGPLIKKINGEFVQIGINSFAANDKCTEEFPSGYLGITSYEDFIEETTNDLSCSE